MFKLTFNLWLVRFVNVFIIIGCSAFTYLQRLKKVCIKRPSKGALYNHIAKGLESMHPNTNGKLKIKLNIDKMKITSYFVALRDDTIKYKAIAG